MPKISAFTIAETLIVLIICSLLLTILYGSLQALEHRYYIYLNQTEKEAQLRLLNQLLQTDFARATHLVMKGNQLTAQIEFPDSEKNFSPEHQTYSLPASSISAKAKYINNGYRSVSVHYLFLDSAIVRGQELVNDTFRIKADSILLGWQDSCVKSYSLVDTLLIDELKFLGVTNGGIYRFHCRKIYDHHNLWRLEKRE